MAEGWDDASDLWRLDQRRTRERLVVHLTLIRQFLVIDQPRHEAAALAAEIQRNRQGGEGITAAVTA